jgi:hypothetical protein
MHSVTAGEAVNAPEKARGWPRPRRRHAIALSIAGAASRPLASPAMAQGSNMIISTKVASGADRVDLWTKADPVTHFDQLVIRPL